MSPIVDSPTADVGSERARELACDHPEIVRAGRVGWIAKGIVYALTGVLGLLVAFDPFGAEVEGNEASQSGAIATIAERPAGSMLLVVMAGGLVVYALWRIMTILLPADNDVETWLNRVGYGVSAAVYLGLAWTAMSFARHPGSSEGNEDARVERITRELLGWSGGRTIVVAAGVVLLVVGGFFAKKAMTGEFESHLEPGGVGPVSNRVLLALGRIGWVGRAAMMGVVGFFLIRAAWRFDPDAARGLDGSLRRAADTPLGTALVLVVGVGLVVYGVFCVLSAPRRRLVPADR